MSDLLQKLLLQARAQPEPKPEWPRWIAEALAYKPESATPVKAPPKPGPAAVDRRHDYRVLSRVRNT
ncbi:hypothetical protein LPJ38_32335 [Bradyrhizobium daqingense]|uniref:Uncharacterized protein n=1 Tax=Bradyrhizobium daqingense TaxID=993502 RepID=A0A562LQR2_9BRAD|nr:hypothetical protein [Bradyrhizobium daqingense]TWI09965.1 hypothetical protein IQ17_01045 [Bradyrhizobium daqingense]UFS88279.1 hypothetical protein LPJ38_32335 [Bradyrhizobium daqingense]